MYFIFKNEKYLIIHLKIHTNDPPKPQKAALNQFPCTYTSCLCPFVANAFVFPAQGWKMSHIF